MLSIELSKDSTRTQKKKKRDQIVKSKCKFYHFIPSLFVQKSLATAATN